MKQKGTGGETIIAEGVKVEGDFVSDGNVTIEGMVHGNVAAGGDMFVGERAVIDADVAAKNLVLAGVIKGNVRIEEKAELGPASTLQGNLSVQVLSVAPGAQVNGSITMQARGNGKKEDE